MTKAKYAAKQEARQLKRMSKRMDMANTLANLYDLHKAELAAQAEAKATQQQILRSAFKRAGY
jgi:hypothetical protein